MATTISRSRPQASTQQLPSVPVVPSQVRPESPFTLAQELKAFAVCVDEPIWVPPKDASSLMAESMLRQSGCLTSKATSWQRVVDQHHDSFTQVREIELVKASIRLPKGKLFVSVTEQRHFDRITDAVPASVHTRLEEFLEGPGKRQGVKVFYLKPLCVEVGNELHFTNREDVISAVEKIQQEVFAEYRRQYVAKRLTKVARDALNCAVAVPRTLLARIAERRQRAVDAYQAKLEFQRRKLALRAAKTHRKCRTHGCTFDEMLALTNPLERADVIQQYSLERQLSQSKQKQLMRLAAGHMPWFVALSMGLSYLSTITLTIAPPLAVCDPAFVAEFPEAPGVLMNIGHFDEIDGVRHIEF